MNQSSIKSPSDSINNHFIRRKHKADEYSKWQSSFALKTLQNLAEERETLQKCVAKIRQFTQVFIFTHKIKAFYALLPEQLALVDDSVRQWVIQAPTKSKFEILYQQSKEQTGKLKTFVMQLLNSRKGQTWLSFRPSHPLLILWNILKLMLIAHICFVFPLMDAFNDEIVFFLSSQRNLFIFEWIFLMVDLVLRFNVQVYHKGHLVQDNKSIARLYIKSGLLVDIFGLIGFTSFLFFDFILLRYLFFLKYPEMQRFLKFLRQELDPEQRMKNHLIVLKLLAVIFILAHLIACVWIWVAKLSPVNWLTNKHYQDQPWLSQYVSSFYFAIYTMTTVGYGDIIPTNINETYVCIVIVVVSSAIFAYTLNTITSVLKDIESDKLKLKEESSLIQSYLIRKGIDSDLQRNVQIYLKQRWKSGQNPRHFQEQEIFAKLSSELQQSVHLQDRGCTMLKVPFLVNNFSANLLKQLMYSIEEIHYQPDEWISKGNGLYIIYKGSVKMTSKINHHCVIYMLNQGNHFGVRSLFQDEQWHFQNQGFSIIYFISTQKFIETLSGEDYERFCMLKQMFLIGDESMLFETCEVCKRRGHAPCQDLIFKPNRTLVLAKENINKEQTRQTFIRKQIKYQILREFKTAQQSSSKFILNHMKAFQDLSSSSLSDSEQSCKFDSSRIDERVSDQEISRGQIQRHSQVYRRTIFMPSFIAPILVKRKQSHEISINLDVKQEQPLRSQQQIESETQIDSLVFDQVKSFNSFYRTSNVDEVLKKFKSRKKKLSRWH